MPVILPTTAACAPPSPHCTHHHVSAHCTLRHCKSSLNRRRRPRGASHCDVVLWLCRILAVRLRHPDDATPQLQRHGHHPHDGNVLKQATLCMYALCLANVAPPLGHTIARELKHVLHCLDCPVTARGTGWCKARLWPAARHRDQEKNIDTSFPFPCRDVPQPCFFIRSLISRVEIAHLPKQPGARLSSNYISFRCGARISSSAVAGDAVAVLSRRAAPAPLFFSRRRLFAPEWISPRNCPTKPEHHASTTLHEKRKLWPAQHC